MDNIETNHVCPVELAGGLDNSLRGLIQNPRRILQPYIKEGMTVLDMGCGPGFFTIEIAKMMNGSGTVIAADLQSGMLEKLRTKISGTKLEDIITLHKCGKDSPGISDKVDFILAFYMVHEVPDQDKLFKEFNAVLKPAGKILIVEPSFHVTRGKFNRMKSRILNNGFTILAQPKILLSRSVLLQGA